MFVHNQFGSLVYNYGSCHTFGINSTAQLLHCTRLKSNSNHWDVACHTGGGTMNVCTSFSDKIFHRTRTIASFQNNQSSLRFYEVFSWLNLDLWTICIFSMFQTGPLSILLGSQNKLPVRHLFSPPKSKFLYNEDKIWWLCNQGPLLKRFYSTSKFQCRSFTLIFSFR